MGARSREDEQLGQILTTGKRRARWRRVIVAAIVLCVAGAAAFFGLRVFGSAGETAALRQGDLKAAITATGTVEALNTVQVGAEVSGKIAALHADFNASVTAGQLLAEIDPEQAKAAVAEAKAQVLAARAGVAKANATLIAARLDTERSKALEEKGLLSKKELETAVSGFELAEASLEAAKASLALAQASYDSSRTKLGKTQIVAPISGTVLSREVEVGQTINAGMQTPVLFTICEDLGRMRLSSSVDEADIGVVKKGQIASFTVDAYPERTFDSVVDSVRNVATISSNVVSYEVLLTVDNSELLLKPGMTASVEIVTLLLKDVLLVPNKALRFSPPAEGRGFRGPPGMPFLGGKPGGRSQEKKAGAAAGKPGEIGAHRAVVWVLEGAAPKRVVVEKLATDGTSTAIESDTLRAGSRVIVDLAETGSPGK